MYQYKGLEDTIVAISTPIGQGGIGIVRLSGKKAVAIADQLFVSKKNKIPSQLKNYTINYGWVVNPENDETLDEVLLSIMRSPNSYTREDIVEISCHGGLVTLQVIVNLAVDLGARLAEPGEFTKRAFLNGRIDLAQAEAVLDIIHSKTESFLKISTNQLKGELSAQLESIRTELTDTYVEIEAIVNFPEDDIDARQKEKIFQSLQHAQEKVEELLKTSDQGRILKEGIKIVLCGKPNVGKSSLLNVLLRTPRAIVSEIAGTTRDTIEETAQIKGIPFQLVDTAGILEPRDLIEEEAIRRSQMNVNSADLVLFLLDSSQKFNDDDEKLIELVKDKNCLVIVNKSDLPNQMTDQEINQKLEDKKIVRISVLNKQGIDELEKAIVQEVMQGQEVNDHGILISNLRHIHALRDCLFSLEEANQIINEGISLEFVSEAIKRAVNFLDSITGRNIDADLLDTIFSQFCIGK